MHEAGEVEDSGLEARLRSLEVLASMWGESYPCDLGSECAAVVTAEDTKKKVQCCIMP